MLSLFMLSVVMLSIVILSVVMLIVLFPSVVMLTVTKLSVVAPSPTEYKNRLVTIAIRENEAIALLSFSDNPNVCD